MILKLQDLYIDTDKIATIGVFENINSKYYEAGFCLNGVNYDVYNAETEPDKEQKEFIHNKLRELINIIIKAVGKEIKEIDIDFNFPMEEKDD